MVSVPQCRFTDLLRSKTFLSLPFLPPLLSISHPKEFSGNRDTLDCPWRIAGQPSAQLLPGTGLGAGPSWGQEGERGKSGVRRGRISWGKVSLCVVLPLPPQTAPGRGVGSQIKRAGPEPWLDFSQSQSQATSSLSPASVSVPLKLIGKVNKMNQRSTAGF